MRMNVIGLGEVLIDFISTEPTSYLEASLFQKCFGGAPMNTIVGASRLGLKTGAVAAVGDDPFGEYLVNVLRENNVDTSRIVVKRDARTTISFVVNDPSSGERTFIFYRSPWVEGAADSLLTPQDIDYDYLSSTEILHVSGFSLSQNPSRDTILDAVRYAGRSGVKVSFDPTLRVDVWRSEETIREVYYKMLRLSDILVLSRDEASFIFGTDDYLEVADKALKFGLDIVGVKLGSEGCFLKSRDGKEIFEPAFKVKAIDTTGAGDGWNAGLFFGLCTGLNLEVAVKVANAVGALVVTRRGAITALPYRHELERFLKHFNIKLNV